MKNKDIELLPIDLKENQRKVRELNRKINRKKRMAILVIDLLAILVLILVFILLTQMKSNAVEKCVSAGNSENLCVAKL